MEFASPPPPPPPPPLGYQAEPPSPPSPPRRRRLPHAAMVGGLVFGMALGGAGIAFAAGSGSGTGSSSTTPATTPNGTPGAPGAGKHHAMFGGRMGGMGLRGLGIAGGRVLYGSATIQTPSGALKTIDFQVGTVTATNISGESGTITVASGANNAHSRTYDVSPSTIVDSQAGGIGTVKTGDTVTVVAQDNGSGNPTAMDIRDQTQMKNSRQGFGFGAPDNQNGQNGSTTNPSAGTASDLFGQVQ